MGILRKVAGAIGGIVSDVSGQSQNIAAERNAQLAEQAFQMQIQNKTWDREDNAVQRRVADLKESGLSPTLAAGGAAQTSQPMAGMAAAQAGGRAAGLGKEARQAKGLMMASEYQKYTSSYLDNKIKNEQLKQQRQITDARQVKGSSLDTRTGVETSNRFTWFEKSLMDGWKKVGIEKQRVIFESQIAKLGIQKATLNNKILKVRANTKYKGYTEQEIKLIATYELLMQVKQQNKLRGKDIKFYEYKGYSPHQYAALMGMAQKAIGAVPGVGRFLTR